VSSAAPALPRRRQHWALPAAGAGTALLELATHGSPSPLPVRLALVALALAPWLVAALLTPPPLLLGPVMLAGAGALLLVQEVLTALVLLVLANGYVAGLGRRALLPGLAAANAAILAAAYAAWRAPWATLLPGLVLSIFMGWQWSVLQRTARERDEARSRLTELTLTEERRRIARDVHDLLAHSLTVVMLHITAARMALARDPGEAAERLAATERLGRQAVDEIRSLIGLLRRSDPEGSAGPPPAAADVTALVDGVRRAGMDAELRVDGDLGLVAPLPGLALFRIAQEALSNAGRHAPGAAVLVEIRVERRETRLSVRNRGAGAGRQGNREGHGLPGMRERAELVGGTLRAGPDGGGWTVECRLPT